jgi:hypothetical protein
MRHRTHAVRRLAAAAVTAGALSLALSGAAGAAAPSPYATTTATTTVPAVGSAVTSASAGRLTHFSCSRADRALTRIRTTEGRIAAGLPKLHAAESRASAAGKTRRAARIQTRIARLERPGVTTRLQGLASAIEAKCSGSTPSTTPATTPSTGG